MCHTILKLKKIGKKSLDKIYLIKIPDPSAFCLVLFSINPFSHGVFFVSRLTAVGHMRHPFKADLGEK
jgi:hypothetical protein